MEESSAEQNRRLETLRKRKQRSEATVEAIRDAERVQARTCACACALIILARGSLRPHAGQSFNLSPLTLGCGNTEK